MNKTFLKIYALLAALVATALPSAAHAAISVGVCLGGKCTFSGYKDYIVTIFGFAMKAGVVLTVLMLIYAGYKYMTSQGNPSALGEAKDIIVGSLTGFAMLVLVYFILTLLGTPISVLHN